MKNTTAARSFPDNKINIKIISFCRAQKATEVAILEISNSMTRAKKFPVHLCGGKLCSRT